MPLRISSWVKHAGRLTVAISLLFNSLPDIIDDDNLGLSGLG